MKRRFKQSQGTSRFAKAPSSFFFRFSGSWMTLRLSTRLQLLLKALCVWALFTIAGWITIPIELVPLFSHCVGLGFYLIIVTQKARWLIPVSLGGFCYLCIVYFTVPTTAWALTTHILGYAGLVVLVITHICLKWVGADLQPQAERLLESMKDALPSVDMLPAAERIMEYVALLVKDRLTIERLLDVIAGGIAGGINGIDVQVLWAFEVLRVRLGTGVDWLKAPGMEWLKNPTAVSVLREENECHENRKGNTGSPPDVADERKGICLALGALLARALALASDCPGGISSALGSTAETILAHALSLYPKRCIKFLLDILAADNAESDDENILLNDADWLWQPIIGHKDEIRLPDRTKEGCTFASRKESIRTRTQDNILAEKEASLQTSCNTETTDVNLPLPIPFGSLNSTINSTETEHPSSIPVKNHHLEPVKDLGLSFQTPRSLVALCLSLTGKDYSTVSLPSPSFLSKSVPSTHMPGEGCLPLSQTTPGVQSTHFSANQSSSDPLFEKSHARAVELEKKWLEEQEARQKAEALAAAAKKEIEELSSQLKTFQALLSEWNSPSSFRTFSDESTVKESQAGMIKTSHEGESREKTVASKTFEQRTADASMKDQVTGFFKSIMIEPESSDVNVWDERRGGDLNGFQTASSENLGSISAATDEELKMRGKTGGRRDIQCTGNGCVWDEIKGGNTEGFQISSLENLGSIKAVSDGELKTRERTGSSRDIRCTRNECVWDEVRGEDTKGFQMALSENLGSTSVASDKESKLGERTGGSVDIRCTGHGCVWDERRGNMKGVETALSESLGSIGLSSDEVLKKRERTGGSGDFPCTGNECLGRFQRIQNGLGLRVDSELQKRKTYEGNPEVEGKRESDKSFRCRIRESLFADSFAKASDKEVNQLNRERMVAERTEISVASGTEESLIKFPKISRVRNDSVSAASTQNGTKNAPLIDCSMDVLNNDVTSQVDITPATDINVDPTSLCYDHQNTATSNESTHGAFFTNDYKELRPSTITRTFSQRLESSECPPKVPSEFGEILQVPVDHDKSHPYQKPTSSVNYNHHLPSSHGSANQSSQEDPGFSIFSINGKQENNCTSTVCTTEFTDSVGVHPDSAVLGTLLYVGDQAGFGDRREIRRDLDPACKFDTGRDKWLGKSHISTIESVDSAENQSHRTPFSDQPSILHIPTQESKGLCEPLHMNEVEVKFDRDFDSKLFLGSRIFQESGAGLDSFSWPQTEAKHLLEPKENSSIPIKISSLETDYIHKEVEGHMNYNNGISSPSSSNEIKFLPRWNDCQEHQKNRRSITQPKKNTKNLSFQRGQPRNEVSGKSEACFPADLAECLGFLPSELEIVKPSPDIDIDYFSKPVSLTSPSWISGSCEPDTWAFLGNREKFSILERENGGSEVRRLEDTVRFSSVKNIPTDENSFVGNKFSSSSPVARSPSEFPVSQEQKNPRLTFHNSLVANNISFLPPETSLSRFTVSPGRDYLRSTESSLPRSVGKNTDSKYRGRVSSQNCEKLTHLPQNFNWSNLEERAESLSQECYFLQHELQQKTGNPIFDQSVNMAKIEKTEKLLSNALIYLRNGKSVLTEKKSQRAAISTLWDV